VDTDDWIDSASDLIDERMLMLLIVTCDVDESDIIVFEVVDEATGLLSEESVCPGEYRSNGGQAESECPSSFPLVAGIIESCCVEKWTHL